ncbi:MAG: hypothetical protein DWC00_07715, partial [Candidatus Poseidoniales archaeon]
MQTIPLFQSPLSPSAFNYLCSPIRLVKPLYEKSTQAGYESLDNHDGHDIAFDSSYLLYLLIKPEIFEVAIWKMGSNNPRTAILYSCHGLHCHHQLERPN